VVIRSYNDHCPAPYLPSLFGWFWRHQVYSGVGAGIVMESITESAGINRYEAGVEETLRERTSDPLGPESCADSREGVSEA